MRPPVEPMRATPARELPQRHGVYEPKWDGFRCLGWVLEDRVFLQSRQLRDLSPYFPEVRRALRGLPVGTVLDGELIIWDSPRGRTSFTALQGRITAGRRLEQEARQRPAHLVVFDILRDPAGELLDRPLRDRRQRLEDVLGGASPLLQLCPQTRDRDEAHAWLTDWPAAGVEGVIFKPDSAPYRPGRAGWAKIKTRWTVEAIVGGVTGPGALLLGRFTSGGRLRYLGLTHPVAVAALETGPALERYIAQHPGAPVAHPWPQPLPAGWTGQLQQRRTLAYTPIRPTLVVEIEVDNAFDEPLGRWRHPARYVRSRPDLSVYDVRHASVP